MEKIILFYKYVYVENPQEIKTWQMQICSSLQLTGRIILAHEGINGTLAGSIENLEKYIEIMNKHHLFAEIDFKDSFGSTQDFPKLKIIIKDEIVRLGIDPKIVSADQAGEYLTPQQVHEFINTDKDVVLFDARNDYESRIGTFRNAITPPIKYFRELPNFIDNNLEQFEDKEVIMFCTGNVRCERSSAYLKSKNIAKKVYHLKGGIHRYVEQYPDGHFRGKNYVFDARVAMRVNDDILAYCDGCAIACDDYINCRNARCNKHCIMCTQCIERLHNACSQHCCDLIMQGNAPKRPIKFKNLNA